MARTAAIGLVVLATVEARQYDSLAALSAIPPWCWWIGATLVALIALVRCSRRERLVIIGILLLVGANWVEQFASLTRAGMSRIFPNQSQRWLRVVSLNCSTGSRRAAEGVVPLSPDVVLLQESPNVEILKELSGELFGEQADSLATSDCSILARGKLRLIENGGHFLHASLARPDGSVVHVVCIRLLPPVVRYDLWAPSCWKEHADARRARRMQARGVADSLNALTPRDLVIVGGDCNAPAGDGAFQQWTPPLRDAFGVAGSGWGATVLNWLPVHRFDQVWSSAPLTPRRIAALRSSHSDHRLVVADFAAPAEIVKSSDDSNAK